MICSFFLSINHLSGQTCCSGGIPIAGNLAFENNMSNVWQFGLMGDFNDLNTLKSGASVLNDQTSEREIYSLILRSGYNITENLVAGAIIPYVRQERWIYSANSTFFSFTQGLGDVILFSQYQLPISNSKNAFQMGFGAKFPTGKTLIENEQGINYNMDMQVGTGSTDFLFWSSYEHTFSDIPTLTFFTQVFYRLNGDYDSYLGDEIYHFGNEWQIIPGLSKQWMVFSQILNTSLLFKVRKMKYNEINSVEIANTGGFWTYMIPSITYKVNPDISFSLAPEIPVYSSLNGTQLTTSFRIRGGISVKLNRQPRMNKNVELK